MARLFAKNNAVLGTGLISHLGKLREGESQPLKDNLNSWLIAWQQATVDIEEMKVSMRIFTKGIEFLMSEDSDEERPKPEDDEAELIRRLKRCKLNDAATKFKAK